ncbi:MAK10-like protein, partial [Tanacetum coccineum]
DPHDTQYCIEDPEQAFVEYASSRTDEAAEGLESNFMASQDDRLSKFETDFKQQQSEMTNKIDMMLKAITDRIGGALPSDMVKNPKLSTSLVLSAHKYVESLELGKNWSAFVQGEIPAKIEDPRLFTLPCRLGESEPFDALGDLGSLADGTKSYPVGIVKDVEVRIGKLKLLYDFYVIDMKKDLETPLLVERGFLATANAVIDCRMAKIAVGEGITRESYKPRPSSDGVGVQTPYYARKDFLDCHLPGEWEIAKDVELNHFKDTLVFRRMVEFLGAIPIRLKSNMWESEDLIKNPINCDKPPKNEDGAWHAMIKLIDSDGEEFTKTLQSIPTTRKLSERESPKEIIDLDHFYNT